MSRPRVRVPRKIKKGDTVTIKTLIAHKMETGVRRNKKTGKLIPRKIINGFEAKIDGADGVQGGATSGGFRQPVYLVYDQPDEERRHRIRLDRRRRQDVYQIGEVHGRLTALPEPRPTTTTGRKHPCCGN